MIAASLLRSPAPVDKKINRLHQLLVQEKEDFEKVASDIPDRALRCTVLSLAQQSNQYAAELSAWLQANRTVSMAAKKTSPARIRNAGGQQNIPGQKAVLHFCSSNEKKIVKAYRRILQDVLLYDGLQDMIGYQLNGILAACMQLNLLNSLTRRPHHSKSLQALA
jgi:hypothetical protein